MSQYFPKPNNLYSGNKKNEIDLSNFATKTDLKEQTGVDTSNLEVKSYLKV